LSTITNRTGSKRIKQDCSSLLEFESQVTYKLTTVVTNHWSHYITMKIYESFTKN